MLSARRCSLPNSRFRPKTAKSSSASAATKHAKARVVPIAKALAEMGFKIYATQHTADVLNAHGVTATVLYKVKDAQVSPNIMDYLQERKIDLVINVPMANRRSSITDILTDGYIIRRQAVEFNIPVITNLQLAAALVEVLKQKGQKRQLHPQPKRVHGRLTLETMVTVSLIFNIIGQLIQ